MGRRRHGQFGDKNHHLLALAKGLLHKVKGSLQSGGRLLLDLLPLPGQFLKIASQQIQRLLGFGGMGPAEFPGPLPQGGGHAQTVGQTRLIQGVGGAQTVGLGLVVPNLLLEQLFGVGGFRVGQDGQILFKLPQHGVTVVGNLISATGLGKAGFQPRQHQADQGQTLIKGRLQ